MNLKYMLKITAIVLGCAAFAGGIMLVTQRIMVEEKPGSAFERRTRELESRDLRVLADPKSPPHEIYAALVRQGRRGLEEAREEALKRREDPDPAVRAGVAESLGFFGDAKAFAAVRALLDDPVPAVRVRALEGVGNRPDPARTPILLKYLERPGIELEEKVSALSSLLRLASADEDRLRHGRGLMAIARSGDGQAETRAAFRAISNFPRDEELLGLLHDKIQADRNSRLIPVAIRHLAAVDDAWITERSAALSRHADPRVRLAIAQTLHRTCPGDRNALLESILMKEANPHVFRAALRQLAYLEEGASAALVGKIRERRRADKEIQKELDEAEARPARKENDPCVKS